MFLTDDDADDAAAAAAAAAALGWKFCIILKYALEIFVHSVWFPAD
jgi:hypothetical protein